MSPYFSFNEFVPYPVHRNDVLRIFRIILELFADVPDMGIHRAGGDVVAPDISQDRVTAHRVAFIGEKKFQDLVFRGREFDLFAIFGDLELLEIRGDQSEFIRLRDSLFAPLRAAQDRFHARDQFPGAEWFGHVIVGAQFQARHLVGFLTQRA